MLVLISTGNFRSGLLCSWSMLWFHKKGGERGEDEKEKKKKKQESRLEKVNSKVEHWQIRSIPFQKLDPQSPSGLLARLLLSCALHP